MEDVIATAARLSAVASVAVAAGLALLTPVGEGSGIVSLIGWAAVAYLAIGLLFGARSSIAAAAVIFVVRIAVGSVLPFDVVVPLAPAVLLLVLMVEFGTASFTFRSRATDPVHTLARAIAMGLVAMIITQLVGELSGAAEATGILVRALGVAALVVVTGWVTLGWRNASPVENR